jgi:hypothetical protein
MKQGPADGAEKAAKSGTGNLQQKHLGSNAKPETAPKR